MSGLSVLFGFGVGAAFVLAVTVVIAGFRDHAMPRLAMRDRKPWPAAENHVTELRTCGCYRMLRQEWRRIWGVLWLVTVTPVSRPHRCPVHEHDADFARWARQLKGGRK